MTVEMVGRDVKKGAGHMSGPREREGGMRPSRVALSARMNRRQSHPASVTGDQKLARTPTVPPQPE